MIAVIKDGKIVMRTWMGVQFTLPNGTLILSGEPGWTDGEYTIGRVDPNDPNGYSSFPEEHREYGGAFIKEDFAYVDEDLNVKHKFTFSPYSDKETVLHNFAKFGITEEDIQRAFDEHPDRDFALYAKAAWKVMPIFSICPLMTGITELLGLTYEQTETLFETKKGT